MKWFWVILALAYIVSPYDLIPDFIPVRGWIDDIIVAFMLWRYLRRFRQTSSAQYRQGEGQSQEQAEDGRFRGHTEDRSAGNNGSRDPFTVLGLSRGADPGEIRAAYRRLANQYHPDKVAHLGREFQELAEQRFKEIQQAYDTLTKRR
ncbi:DnaJ domain-containing protein [Desulfatitalea alkaliphila]|uniref:DnaJ domain-containing protein n=1 Tax=Desulfatitalea alkaliphila TaxID=2929485 RepID=A0AA41ULU1_9BACT|nr:DnaJ domain-containing protein [Desulfatitalea alkaliphila]MCJ8501901.1 DnaJ domain-containing protein [Desulfatitalea alkaliphila]